MVIPIRDDNPTTKKPVLTIAIIVACIYIFAAVQPHQTHRGDPVPRRARRHPLRGRPRRPDLATTCPGSATASCGSPICRGRREPFPDKNVFLAVVVSMFLHGSWLHVLGNMLFLWVFGNNIEERLGPVGYAFFYLVAGVAAALRPHRHPAQLHRAGGRGVGGHRRGHGRLSGALSEGPDPDDHPAVHLPAVRLPAGLRRAGRLVRPPVLHQPEHRRRRGRPHRRVRLRGGDRPVPPGHASRRRRRRVRRRSRPTGGSAAGGTNAPS